MAEQKRVTAAEIKMALERRHRDKDFFITECKTGPTWVGSGYLKFDGLAIAKSWAHPKITGYEIKVSRSDFLSDAKYREYLPFCHEFYFVVPTGLVDRLEVDTDIGLIYYNQAKESLNTRRKAPYRDIEVLSELLMYIIMNRLDSDRVPFYSSKAEYFRAWVEGKAANRDLGYRVKNKMVDTIRELEEQKYHWEAVERQSIRDKELLDQVRQVLLDSGKMTRVGGYDLVDQLRSALARSTPVSIEKAEAALAAALEALRKMKDNDIS